jgi:hypothetical protein
LINQESGHRRFTTSGVTVTDGQAYTVSFWVRGTGSIRTGLFDGRASGSGYSAYNDYEIATSTWTQYSHTLTAANDTTAAEFILSIQLSSGPEHVVVDNVTISVGGVVNPAIPHTIYEIQYTTDPDGDSPLQDSTVETGGIVTAAYASGFWMQNGPGPWSGLFVFTTAIAPVEGDSVIVAGDVTEFNGLTEINNVSSASIESSGNIVPPPVGSTTGAVGSEPLESVLVSSTGYCVDTALSTNFGQWQIDDGSGFIRVDDLIYHHVPVLGAIYTVTGPLYWSFNEWKIEPRDLDDVVTGIHDLVPMEVSILPNPVSDRLLVEWSGSEAWITLSDAQGRQVLNTVGRGGRQYLEVGDLLEGLYFLTLRDEGRLLTERIVVQR